MQNKKKALFEKYRKLSAIKVDPLEKEKFIEFQKEVEDIGQKILELSSQENKKEG